MSVLPLDGWHKGQPRPDQKAKPCTCSIAFGGPPLSETGQKQSLCQNCGRPSKNGQSLVLMSGVLRAIRFGRALRARGLSGFAHDFGPTLLPMRFPKSVLGRAITIKGL